MTPGARRVRRVRLAAPRPELVRRGAVLLEDALHTASIPGGAGGRLVLVRRLDVGRIRAGAPPSTLALAIEARLREAETAAVHADSAAADGAPAVFFRDAGEAAALLCARLARGGETGAWFWRAAVPGWTPALGPADGIRLALRIAADSAPGAAAVARVLRVAMERGALDRVLATVDHATAAELITRAGWSFPRRSSRPLDTLSADRPGDAAPREWRAALERWIAAWGGEEDARSIWLAASALVDERPARAADPHLPARALDLAASILRPLRPLSPVPADLPHRSEEQRTSVDRDRSSAPSADEDRPTATLRESADAAVDPDRSTSPDAGEARQPQRSAMPGDDDPHLPPPTDASEIEGDPRQTGDPAAKLYDSYGAEGIDREDESASAIARLEAEDRPIERDPDGREGAAPVTEAAGLFFLVPAMERLGMAECVARHPGLLEADLPARVLLRIAARLRVPADDAAVRALATGDLDVSRAARRPTELDDSDASAPSQLDDVYAFTAPAAWARTVIRPGVEVVRAMGDGGMALDASGRLLVRAGPGIGLEAIVDAWATALRRWCRRRARVGLRALVLRRGRIASTRTHVDVTMPLSSADVRVRAAGLDLDPGWVPWLGRVVAFHYED
ncbi:MAG TPA: hypothetical protein VFR81_01780 [Longimicrobium sp.]|nr:hypothetical protein [Longimicrobium sp.]